MIKWKEKNGQNGWFYASYCMVHMPWFIAYGPQAILCDTKDFDENLREFILGAISDWK